MELALRDVVARVIETEIAKVEVMARDLELMFCAMYTTLGKEKILKDLPKIRHTAMLFENIDLVDTLVPIRLTAHYSMGGIEVAKFEDMSTKIAGIYVGGEASCISIYGANRLGEIL